MQRRGKGKRKQKRKSAENLNKTMLASMASNQMKSAINANSTSSARNVPMIVIQPSQSDNDEDGNFEYKPYWKSISNKNENIMAN